MGVSQVTTVSGKVTEASTGSAVPFANVLFSGTTEGAITNFEGEFTITTSLPVDSLEARYIGFITRRKVIRRGVEQVINFQLEEDVQTLEAVMVYAGENPAFPILRKVIENKKVNDKRNLAAYDYEAYTKIEIDVDNVPERLKRRKIMRKITALMDSAENITGEDGQPILPIFISEAISRQYYRSNPRLKTEHVLKTKVTGIGITDGTLTSQVIGATLQEYNFYQNWLNIVSKEFISPIADGWKLYYDYDLIDSMFMAGDSVYRIDFYPKRPQDRAFQGTMWITREDYALKRIDASVNRQANLNFVNKLKIQQELVRTGAGAWMPLKSRVVVDLIELTGSTPSMLAKFYVSARDIQVNEPKRPEFYQNPVTMDQQVRMYDEDYWATHRHDSLTPQEVDVYAMIDTLRRVPIVRFGTDMGKFALTGYYKAGPLDLGPYTVFYGDNDIEGQRVGFGMRSNIDISRHFTVGGYAAYGFGDQRWKYQGYFEYILSRKNWSTLRVEHQRELDQIWLLTQNIDQNSLFYTLSRFGNLIDPFLYDKTRLRYSKQITTGLSQEVELKHQAFKPQFDFAFDSPLSQDGSTLNNFEITELSLRTRYAKDEVFVVNDNQRLSLGTIRSPAITFSYTYGMPNVFGSDLEYHRFRLGFEKRQRMGLLGIANINLSAGYLSGTVPYPLLFNPIGNETPVFVNFAYNLMNFFEFSSDRFVSVRYSHSFDGLIMNKVPLFRRLKWRLLANANVIYGGMRSENRELVNYPVDEQGNPVFPFSTLEQKPYIELGYGVENIFRVFRVDAFHRLTYLDRPGISSFGIKFSVQFML
jgi:hypothetical protein